MKGIKGKTIVLIVVGAVLFSTAVFTTGCSHQHEYVLKHTETEHWYECTTCGEEKDRKAHDFKWVRTETEHWRECSVCGEFKDAGEHDGENCTICAEFKAVAFTRLPSQTRPTDLSPTTQTLDFLRRRPRCISFTIRKLTGPQ